MERDYDLMVMEHVGNGDILDSIYSAKDSLGPGDGDIVPFFGGSKKIIKRKSFDYQVVLINEEVSFLPEVNPCSVIGEDYSFCNIHAVKLKGFEEKYVLFDLKKSRSSLTDAISLDDARKFVKEYILSN